MTDNRLKHSASVAEFMYESATDKGWSTEKCQEMFILGYLHDIGYQFTEVQEEHNTVGGLILKSLGYSYWKEVYNHGKVQSKYRSVELDLLNTADLSIDSSGNFVGVHERLTEIMEKYGDASIQYIEATELALRLGLIKGEF